MKLKNKKFRIFSAIASLSAIATLASVSITSCTHKTKAAKTTSANTIEVQDNSVYSTVTFNGNGGIVKGDVSIKVRTGKPFGSIKAPIATRSGFAFVGWFTEATAGQQMLPTTTITDSLTVYAHWTDVQTKTLTFSKGTTDAVLKGPTSVDIVTGQNFAQVSRPDAISPTRDFKGWALNGEFIEDEQALTYDSIPAENTFTPVFYEPKAYQVQITADDYASDGKIALQYNSQLTAKVIGQTGVSQAVTWSSSNPDVLTVNDGLITPVSKGNATITAKSTIEGTDISGNLTIEVVDVIEKYTEDVYVSGVPTGQTLGGYWKVDMDTLCTDDDTITNVSLTRAGTNEQANVPKSSFNMPIVIGSDIWYIPSFFLEGCAQFNSTITFSGNNVIYIGESFMGGCSNFAQTFVLPSKIMVILNDFMYGCTNFKTTAVAPFVLPSTLTYVGDSFMVNCDNVQHVAVNCDLDVIHADETIDTLTVNSTSAPAYAGLVITGSVDLAQFKVKFPELTEAPIYRIYSQG